MGYHIKPPHPDTFVAENAEYNAKLYAELADVPLYVQIRILAPELIGKRSSFRVGWIIEEQRMAVGKDSFILPEPLTEWITEQMLELYPDHASTTGLTSAEIQEIKREQKEKREAHIKRKA